VLFPVHEFRVDAISRWALAPVETWYTIKPGLAPCG
jgi:hypothetical protein